MEKQAIQIVETLKANGFQAVFAGGFVRDMLLSVSSGDIDIATDALPEQVESLFEKTVAVGKSFGVIVVIVDGIEFEVCTFRNDGKYSDNRHPESVEFSSIEEDAKRRDFTINGLFYDPIDGKLLDFVDGEKDLKAGIIRFIGDAEARISEDKLRILRGVRFALRFGFDLEESTYAAIKRNAKNILLVSKERIRDEIIKMVKLDKPEKMFELLFDTGLIHYVLPEIEKLKGVKQDPEWHPEGDVFCHTVKVMENLKGESLEVLFAGMFHDIGKPETFEVINGRITNREHAKIGAKKTRDILEGLKFPNKFIEYVGELVYDHMRMLNVKGMKKSKQKRFFSQDNFSDLMALHIADEKGGFNDLSIIEKVNELILEYGEQSLKPEPLIDGRDLIGIGFCQGALIGQVKTEIYDMQLEGQINTKDEALEYARNKLGA